MRNAQWHTVDRSHGLGKKVSSGLRWLISAAANPLGLRIPLLGSRLLFPLVSRFLKRRLPINADLACLIESGKYDAIIFPSAGFDSVTVDVIKIAAKNGIPSICLIDNWDNLSSKTVFWVKPDYLAVWGEQTRQQALSIHSFNEGEVRAIGTPRFGQYFEAREIKLHTKPYSFPYILFVGSAMPFDEISALHEIERGLSLNNSVPSDLRVVYRPHPWQQKRQTSAVFNASQFSRTILDLQISQAYAEGQTPEIAGTSFQPKLDYYPSLLVGAECVVGPLTTMLLEATLCLRPVVALNYHDGFHSNTSLRYFSHFDGAESIPGFKFCESASELGGMLVSAVNSDPPGAQESDRETSFFIFHSKKGYPRELLDFVNYALKKS